MIAALLLQAASIAAPDAVVPDASMAEPTAALAARTFAVPPAGIVSHQLRTYPDLPQSPSVEFFTKVERFGEGLCRRKSYYVAYYQVGRGSAPIIEQEKLAIAGDCSAIPDAQFASIQPASAVEDAAIALRWLADKQRRGDSAGVTCLPSPYKPNPCAIGTAAMLRRLPLDHIRIIDRGARPGEWSMAVMPNGLGNLFYNVHLSRDSNGTPAVTIKWDAPAPF